MQKRRHYEIHLDDVLFDVSSHIDIPVKSKHTKLVSYNHTGSI